MLRPYLPGFVLSAAVVAAAAGVFASIDGDRDPSRPTRLSGGAPPLEVRLPAEALPRRAGDRKEARARVRTGELVATTRGVVRSIAVVGVPRRSSARTTEGVARRTSGRTRLRARGGAAQGVAPTPAPAPTPQQATPVSGADDAEPGRVRAPEAAARSDSSGSEAGDAGGVEDIQDYEGGAADDTDVGSDDDVSEDDPVVDDGSTAADGP